MPTPTGRRHPLFLRLLKPVESVFPDRVTPVVLNSNDEDDEGESEGIVYLVAKPCAQMLQWARELKAQHAVDHSHKTEERISRLSLNPLRTRDLARLGRVECELYGQGDSNVGARSACILYWSVTMIAVLVDKLDGVAVGFVSFAVKWDVHAGYAENDMVEIEVQPDQVWIAPAFRGRRWSDSLAYAVSSAARAHIDLVDQSCRWGSCAETSVKVIIGAEIYSSSGEAFLRQCCEHLDVELSFRLKGKGLKIVRLDLDARL